MDVESWVCRRKLAWAGWAVAGGLLGEHLGYRIAWGATAVFLFSLLSCRVTAITSTALCAEEPEVDTKAGGADRSERLFRSVVQSSSDVVLLLGPDRRVRYASPAVMGLLGLAPSAVVSHGLRSVLHPGDVDAVGSQVALIAAGQSGMSGNFSCRVRHMDGSWRDADVVATNLMDDPDVEAIVLNVRDVTVRRALQQQLEEQALFDRLTGLPNRTLFIDRVGHALTRNERESCQVAVLFLDIDDFQSVNDTMGHPAGDVLLQRVAERLGSATRPGDTVARLGGDEFAVLLEVGTMPQTAEHVATRIVDLLGQPFDVEGTEYTLGVSIGIAVRTAGDQRAADLMRDADLAMYVAKREGKSRHVVFEPAMRADALRRVALVGELRRGLAGEELVPFYQPIVDSASGAVIGAEALVRWHHPERGLVPPLEFIGAAESTGLIVPLGRTMLLQACRDARELQETGVVGDDFYVSVNLSARQLGEPSVEADVRNALEASGLSPTNLVLEVTESALIEDLDDAMLRLASLKALGVRIAVDDFGTGYSSLSYLGTLPVDLVKIDKSFVDHVSDGQEGRALVQGVIDLSRALGLATTAEGVESVEQRHDLAEMGCDTLQGFLFARPMPADELVLALATWPTYSFES
jgi:diguanylate cyclase (GGDEF)-like protein/PAS domain S-box-containing protein